MSHVYHDSHVCDDSGVSRRDALCAGGAAMFIYLVTGLLGAAKTARVQALSGPVPEVDRLAVRVVTDSYQLAIAPNMKVGEVEVQRFGMPPAGKSLLGEFGLAMHLESRRGNETRNMLLDFGFTPDTLNNNLRMLGIAPESITRLRALRDCLLTLTPPNSIVVSTASVRTDARGGKQDATMARLCSDEIVV